MTTPHLPPARGLADLTTGTVFATVDVAAPPERVFQALTDPKELVKWWGSPEVYRTEDWRVDLRVGGKWEVGGHMADGSPFHVGGEFVAIEPPTRLVYTWHPDWFPGLATTLTYRLQAIPGGTRVTLRHEGFGERGDACRSHADGWEQVLSWLATYLNAQAKPAGIGSRFFNPLRVATYLLLFYAFVHTAGALFNTPSFSPQADAVLASMRSVHFPVQGGVERTWFNFWFGFGIIDSVFFVASAAIAWFMGGRSLAERRTLRAITWILFLSYAASIVIILQNFFAGPLVFSSLITLCFGIECWRVTRSSPARG